MNTKKTKSKTRVKPQKNTEETTTEVLPENIVLTQEIEQTQILNSEVKIELSEKISENVAVEEGDKLTSDTPKKPKRKKAKKKQDVLIGEHEPLVTDDLNKEKVPEQGDVENKNKTEELLNIVPTSRKKKSKGNKNKEESKTVECVQIETECTEKSIEHVKLEVTDNKSIENLETKPEMEHKDQTGPKKKKKKKHRHDSEKSDVNDPCTLAFQKLLKAEDMEGKDKIVDDNVKESVIEETLKHSDKDLKDTQETKEVTVEESLKSRKKNKKGKKLSESDLTHDEQRNSPNILKPDITSLETETSTPENSPKPKAKIAKPVQKKRKEKSVLLEVTHSTSLDLEKKEIIDNLIDKLEGDDVKVAEKVVQGIISPKTDDIKLSNDYKEQALPPKAEEFQELSNSEKNSKYDTSNSHKDKVPLTSVPNVNSEVETTVITQAIEKQIEEPSKESDNTGFIEVKSGKNKKKRLTSSENLPEIIANISSEVKQDIEVKSEPISETNEKSEIFYDIQQLDIKENAKPEELEGLKTATPDLIQYPRSTSQLNMDSNNNTTIKEILTPDEVKLGIPFYIPTPIIEGSGESPEIKLMKEPVNIEVTTTEPICNIDSNEKTDIKSKMFEVNKEMEELRKSIERSLAELTGSEKCDGEVEKEFEEIFQSQVKESVMADKPNVQATTSDPQKTSSDGPKAGNKAEEINTVTLEVENEQTSKTETEIPDVKNDTPECPARSKTKGKSKRKGKKEPISTTSTSSCTAESQEKSESKKESSNTAKDSDKSDQKSNSSESKGKQQSIDVKDGEETSHNLKLDLSFEPIENFEDALTSSIDDVNKTFEIIAKEALQETETIQFQNTPQINVIAPSEDSEEGTKNDQKQDNPISQPKNLLGHPNIPVSSNKTDYKKEKSKPPSSIQAKVKIKDEVDIEKTQNQNKTAETNKKIIKETNGHEAFSCVSKANDDFIYKYNFRKVFLQSACHVCKLDLIERMPCQFCNLVFYCSKKHKNEDFSKHQSLCFAVSTIAHLKGQKHIYADAQNITGHNYRVLRMQMIISCEKILKRKLVPWEQEALLYPRICADVGCREWRQSRLKDCSGCGQISYCADHPNHLPSNHQRWCKSYALYQKLVNYQQTKGRLEPKLPTRVLTNYHMKDNLNQVLGSMYEEKIDMDDIQYAALTQIATGPLTAAYAYQLYCNKHSSISTGISKKSSITIHLIAPDLQFEADVLNKWEIFFLHLFGVQHVRVVLVGRELNPSKLPTELLANIRLCENCRTNNRRVVFDFHEQSYQDYYSSDDFVAPDIVCAFNPNIQRSSTYKQEDTWSPIINCILKQRTPFLLTSFTLNELNRDLNKIKSLNNNFIMISDIKHNPFCSVRPDRNFISDNEMPLLFKNYCFTVLCGV